MTQSYNLTRITIWVSLIVGVDPSVLSRHIEVWMSGKKPPRVDCIIDPCSMKNVCDGGRECELADFCQHRCLCTEQSTHESCVKSSVTTSTFKPNITAIKLTSASTTVANDCAINPCSVPNVCGDGRRCELDKTCEHTCVCLDNIIHENCKPVTSLSKPTTSSSVRCSFNPCSTSYNFCGEGRRCDFDKKTCKHNCVCLDEFTHANCRTTITKSPNKDTSRNCPPGFPCEHGYCELPDINCICDNGWGGRFCDKQCTKECEAGSKCVLKDLTESCIKANPKMKRTNPDEDEWTNVCSIQYRQREKSERSCKYGMVCKYGVCVDLDDQSSHCECDRGAFGTFCSRKCCRDCGARGTCFLDASGQELCNCHYKYTGPSCNILKQGKSVHSSR